MNGASPKALFTFSGGLSTLIFYINAKIEAVKWIKIQFLFILLRGIGQESTIFIIAALIKNMSLTTLTHSLRSFRLSILAPGNHPRIKQKASP
jgi:uncharacterized membrane protein YdfJ with MMPL/SSD domain